MIQIIGPGDKALFEVINTTSSSRRWSKGLSPFYLGPVRRIQIHDYRISSTCKIMENAWQFSKVYPEHVDENNNPTDKYYEWAQKGFQDDWAHRYPMGKNKKPLYSLYDDEHLGYIDARKIIYINYYTQCVIKSEAYNILKQEYNKKGNLSLFDYDGYDNIGLEYGEIINNPNKIMGHAFVLGMLLEKYI